VATRLSSIVIKDHAIFTKEVPCEGRALGYIIESHWSDNAHPSPHCGELEPLLVDLAGVAEYRRGPHEVVG